MTKIDLADVITEEAERQAQEPVEPLAVEKNEVETAAPIETKPKSNLKTKKKPAKPKVEEPETVKVAVPRRTAWLQEDHLDRLEVLKRKERARLRDDPEKRVAITSLIDEAIEQYLKKME